jgi:hypothetical protein
MFYDLTYLSIRPNQLGPVLSGLPASLPEATRSGELIGCMSCDIGVLNRIAVLTAYEDLEKLNADRAATLNAADPYGVSAYLGGIDKAAFKPLSFAADIEPGSFGPFYEIRTYEIAPGGLTETETAWSKVVERRNTLSKLLMVMASVDTLPTRMVHFWPYKGLDERAKMRAEASKMGIWPPPGGSNHLLSLRSEVFVPLPISPLR